MIKREHYFNLLNAVKKILLAYLIPIINMILIFVLSNSDPIFRYSLVNIVLATNTCYIVTIDRYFKLREELNSLYTVLTYIGIIISSSFFFVSTVLILIDNFNVIHINFYYLITVVTLIISLVIAYIAELESKEKEIVINDAITKKRSEDLLEQVKQDKKTVKFDGKEFKIGGKTDE